MIVISKCKNNVCHSKNRGYLETGEKFHYYLKKRTYGHSKNGPSKGGTLPFTKLREKVNKDLPAST